MFRWLHREPRIPAEQEQRVLDALVGYPPYEPPEWNPDTKSLMEANAEYKAFFFANRIRRIEIFRAFLAKFDVASNLDDAGIMATSEWCPLYADLLVHGLESDTVWSAYHGLAASWTGPLLGLNAIFDLGVYYGECLLLRNSRLRWHPSRGPEPNTAAHPIFGQRNRRPFDPVDWMYTWCKNVRSAKLASSGPAKQFTNGTALSRHIHAQANA